MDRALDYAAKSTDPSAPLWRAGRRKHYDEIPVRRIEAVCSYDHAFDHFTLRASVAEVVSAILIERPILHFRRWLRLDPITNNHERKFLGSASVAMVVLGVARCPRVLADSALLYPGDDLRGEAVGVLRNRRIKLFHRLGKHSWTAGNTQNDHSDAR